MGNNNCRTVQLERINPKYYQDEEPDRVPDYPGLSDREAYLQCNYCKEIGYTVVRNSTNCYGYKCCGLWCPTISPCCCPQNLYVTHYCAHCNEALIEPYRIKREVNDKEDENK